MDGLSVFWVRVVAGMDAIWATTGVARLPEQRFSWVGEALLYYGSAIITALGDTTLGRLE